MREGTHWGKKKKESKINKRSLCWQLTALRTFLMGRADLSPSQVGAGGGWTRPALVPRAARVTPICSKNVG